jgi:hypothetical protein
MAPAPLPTAPAMGFVAPDPSAPFPEKGNADDPAPVMGFFPPDPSAPFPEKGNADVPLPYQHPIVQMYPDMRKTYRVLI